MVPGGTSRQSPGATSGEARASRARPSASAARNESGVTPAVIPRKNRAAGEDAVQGVRPALGPMDRRPGREVDHLQGLLEVQLAAAALLVHPVPVEDT